MKPPIPKVHPVLKVHLPEPRGDELARLYASIDKYGAIIPILVTENGYIVEGYHRFEYYVQHKIKKYPIAVIPGLETIEAMKKWMDDHQLARRNLTDAARLDILGRKYVEAKNPVGNPNGDTVSGLTADAIATEHNVSPRTVYRAGEFHDAVESQPTTVRPAILAGQVPVKTVVEAAKQDIPLFCERCTRVGLVKKCPKCAELQAAVKKNKPKSKNKKGEALIDWPGFEKSFGVVVRLSDRVHEHYATHITADDKKDYENSVAVLTRLYKLWKKSCTGGGA